MFEDILTKKNLLKTKKDFLELRILESEIRLGCLQEDLTCFDEVLKKYDDISIKKMHQSVTFIRCLFKMEEIHLNRLRELYEASL